MASSAVAGVDYSRRVPTVQRASRQSLLPNVTLCGALFEDDLVLAKPIEVTFERAGGKIVASDDLFHMYGEGNTRQEAVRDYLSSLAEYYMLLGSCDDKPSLELFSFLQTYLHTT